MRQCKSHEGMKELDCQGVSGHLGPHWAYDPLGELILWKNKQDKDDPEWKRIACAWIPPGAKTYIHPKVMYKKSYLYARVEQDRKNAKRNL